MLFFVRPAPRGIMRNGHERRARQRVSPRANDRPIPGSPCGSPPPFSAWWRSTSSSSPPTAFSSWRGSPTTLRREPACRLARTGSAWMRRCWASNCSSSAASPCSRVTRAAASLVGRPLGDHHDQHDRDGHRSPLCPRPQPASLGDALRVSRRARRRLGRRCAPSSWASRAGGAGGPRPRRASSRWPPPHPAPGPPTATISGAPGPSPRSRWACSPAPRLRWRSRSRSSRWVAAPSTEIAWLASRHQMALDDYVLNQAVVNPLWDLIREYVPVAFAGRRPPYRLEPTEALPLAQRLLGIPEGDRPYPLLRTLRGASGLGIRNVIVIQVEGSRRHPSRAGRAAGPGHAVPPLARRRGSLLSAALPELPVHGRRGLRDAHQSSLDPRPGRPAVCGSPSPSWARTSPRSRACCAPETRHYAFSGFRHRTAEIVSFHRTSASAPAASTRSRAVGPAAVGPLGINDGPLPPWRRRGRWARARAPSAST